MADRFGVADALEVFQQEAEVVGFLGVEMLAVAAIASAIVAMARSLGLSVVAEGVETDEQRMILLSLGCTRFQGYLFGKPKPASQWV